MGLSTSLPLISRILGKPHAAATRPTTVSVGTRATFPALRASTARGARRASSPPQQHGPWRACQVVAYAERYEAGFRAQTLHLSGLPFADFQHHVRPTSQQRGRLGEDTAEERELVGTAVEGNRWVPFPHLRCEPAGGADLVHVRRVRDEEVDRTVQEMQA